MTSPDTIAAISSAPGPSPRMIVRLSGANAWTIAQKLAPTIPFHPRIPVRVPLRIKSFTIPTWIYPFQAPHSYTAENLIEFHLPGNVLLARLLMEALISHGARPAEPGEFTARAYFNARMDLTEAEGVAALVSAHNETELRAARQLLSGELARRLHPIMDSIAETLGLIEVAIDFSEEDVTFLTPEETTARIATASDALTTLLSQSAQFERLAHEPTIVLAGRPNAGKSTLLNALSGRPRAVVSEISGTTRDALSTEIKLPRGLVRMIDVAGLEETPEEIPDQENSPTTEYEKINHDMRARALHTIETADLVLLVHDITDPQPLLQLPRIPSLTLHTKSDLRSADPTATTDLPISAHTGAGLDKLRARLDQLCFATDLSPSIALNARHRAAISAAHQSLLSTQPHVPTNKFELIALGLRESLDSLSQILGAISPDDVLGKVFSRFCIGK